MKSTKRFKNKIIFQTFSNLEEAVKKIILDINFSKQKNFNILFSPAAASFDQFTNFGSRGDYFKNLIIKHLYTSGLRGSMLRFS